MIVVIVPPDIRARLEAFALERDRRARAAGKHHNSHSEDTSREYQKRIHIDGVIGEWVVCEAMGVEYPWTIDTYHDEPDIPPDIEVRTRSEHWHELIVRKTDNENQRFVLVTGQDGRYVVRGWIWGYEAKRDEWWKNHGRGGWAWFVPQKALHPLWFES